jgi:hypothetical protein
MKECLPIEWEDLKLKRDLDPTSQLYIVLPHFPMYNTHNIFF